MKTSFKKSVAVLMVALMLLSAFSVSVFAATTYSVTYKPGTYAKETDEYVQDGIEKNEYINLLGAKYTRTGYTQLGWSTNKNGTTRTYTLEKAQKITKNLTLYPYWTVSKYTITFAGGEFGEGTVQTKEVNFNKNTKAPGAIFTREGYIQVGWTATV
ncbi:MAG: InlB B-repeat-containing protein, partial [Clostridia bacterium]|nr:InlB B-repeat-containing protein [Clostridia bacterium]